MSDTARLAIFTALLFCCCGSVGASSNSTARKAGPACEGPHTLTYTVLFVFMVTASVLTVSGNAFVCGIICKTPKFTKNNTYQVFFSLAVADLLIGAVIMPINARKVYNNGVFCMGEFTCWFLQHYLERTLSITSMIHLFVIGIDRYLSLKFTYQYQERVTKGKTRFMIALLWVYALICSLLGVFQWHTPHHALNKQPSLFSVVYKPGHCSVSNDRYFLTMYIVCFYVPICVMVYTYAFVYRTAVRHLKDIQHHELGEKQEKELRRKKRQHRTFQSVVIVFIVYLIFWLPFAVTHTIAILSPQTILSFRENAPGIYRVFAITISSILPPLNSASNPLIYVISNRQFRQRVVELMRRKSLDEPHSTNTVMLKMASTSSVADDVKKHGYELTVPVKKNGVVV